jgi:sorbitol/mannitol transport system permease protein
VLAISVVGGTLLAVLFDQPFRGRGIARLLVIGPFFVMPTVAALIWKNMIMHPVYGILAYAMRHWGWSPSTGWPSTRCCRSSSLWPGSGFRLPS